MIAPKKKVEFMNAIRSKRILHKTFINDVESLIKNQTIANKAKTGRTSKGFNFNKLKEINEWLHSFGKSHPKKEEVISASFSFEKFNTLEEINTWLDSLAKSYPEKVQVISAGRTYQNRSIKGVKLTFNASNPGIFIEGGMHAREWLGPATAVYLLNQLLTSEDPEIRKLAESNNWYIFPVVNPDGYVYTHEKVLL